MSGGFYLAKQRNSTPPGLAPARLRQEAITGPPRLLPSTQRYRVVAGDKMLGQFSNPFLAEDAALGRRNAVIMDIKMCPHRKLYENGKWISPIQ